MQHLDEIKAKSLANTPLSKAEALRFLDDDLETLDAVHSAYQVRKQHFDKKVTIHIINNAQNGACPEDCGYCAQSKNSSAPIEKYRLKSEFEILEEARTAYENGAHRYCMVSSGRGPKDKRIDEISKLIRKIKEKYPIEICLSAGLMDEDKVKMLKEAGLDRLNHNLNTSKAFYPKICTTHDYDDRLKTLKAAQKAGLSLCSGIIVGMGESKEDIVDVAMELRRLEAPSIPVNFLLPIKGTQFEEMPDLTPEFCLKVLSLFRMVNPKAEIRVAAGREVHFRSMEAMALYPANSLFLEGYLNTRGEEALKVYEMISDAGFEIESEKDLQELIEKHKNKKSLNFSCPAKQVEKDSSVVMKTMEDLRPSKV